MWLDIVIDANNGVIESRYKIPTYMGIKSARKFKSWLVKNCSHVRDAKIENDYLHVYFK